MDLIPKIIENGSEGETSTEIRNAFQEELHKENFPLDIANNISRYNVDDDLSLVETAKNAIQINQDFLVESDHITSIEKIMINQHAEFLILSDNIEKDEFLREMSRIKSCDIFGKTRNDLYDVINYGLLHKSDLFPDITRQFLDFRYNTFHRCKNCLDTLSDFKTINRTPHKTNRISGKTYEKKGGVVVPKPFEVEPNAVIFLNYQPNILYQQEIKLINTSKCIQSISMRKYPKLNLFHIVFESQRIAPGMSARATIQFKTDIYLNECDDVSFITGKGQIVNIPLQCTVDPPKLHGFINRSNDNFNFLLEENYYRNKLFSAKRKKVLNQTIDCGACFATDYVLITLYLINTGHDARFFIINEENWFNKNVDSISDQMEHHNQGFWIYPTYFEIKSGEISEINIIFQPLTCSLHMDTLFLICSNNTYQEINILGDAVCFNKNMITVGIPNVLTELENKPKHCIFLKYTKINELIAFTLSIRNKSQLSLKYTFKFCSNNDESFDMSNWIKTQTLDDTLPPYGTNDIIFYVNPQSTIRGYYNTFLRVYIKNIPIASLDEDENFVIENKSRPLKEIVETMSYVDVLLVDVEVACFVRQETEIEENQREENSFRCGECCNEKTCCCCKEHIPDAIIIFSEQFLDLSILPIGVDIKRDLYIINVGKQQLNWNIIEMRYNIDKQPFVQIMENPNISECEGVLMPNQKKLLSYKIIKQKRVRWVSVLILFSYEQTDQQENISENVNAESICLVTYEISTLDIVVKSSHSQEPIICPLQMLYVGIPIDIDFELQNNSLMNGCFYFLKPKGKESEKISVEYKPQCGVIKAYKSTKINLKLTCNDIGILEDIYLPCFIGKGQELISIRLLCVVDCIHVFFYLPCKNNLEFQKVLWPPKVVYECDTSWSQYCIYEDLTYEDAIRSIHSNNELKTTNKSNETLNILKQANIEKIVNSESAVSVQEDYSPLKTIVNADTEIFLQDLVVEVKHVAVKTPQKIRFYIENVTPISTSYSIQCTSYGGKSNCIKKTLETIYKTTDELWEPMIERHGILVQPEIESGLINAHELIFVDIWIYSNTWGIYTEEIIVDISNIPSFSCSLVIEVIGCPLQVPLGMGSIVKYPTIRLGSISMHSDDITRNIIISNISSIDVNVVWHVFTMEYGEDDSNVPAFNFLCDVVGSVDESFNFDFTEKYHGEQSCKFIEIYPSKMTIIRKSKTTIEILFMPKTFQSNQNKCPTKCFILGRIFINEDNRFKSNYFYRNNNSLLLELTATFIEPYLEINADEDNTNLYIYANDILVYRKTTFWMKFTLRNPLTFTVKAQLIVSEPFCLEDLKDTIVLRAGEGKEIILPCFITYEMVQKWAAHVYGVMKDSNFKAGTSDNAQKDSKIAQQTEKSVDECNKILTLNKKLLIHYHEEFKQVVPLHVHIYYPHITVKPIHLKFAYVLIGCTEMASIRVFNLTGCKILFEIYKTTSTQEIVVNPPHGEIEESTGDNFSFRNISIYFTPTQSRNYQECIRIITNVPQYYIDVPIKGTGSRNEKFDTI